MALTGLSASMVSQAAAGAFATATDPETGVTTTSVKNADGSRDVTKTDADGKVISKHNVYRDRHTGNTETTVENADGSVTHTHVDPQGNVLFVETDPAPAAPTDGISEFEEWGDSDWDDTACQRRSKNAPLGRSKTTPLTGR
ncbi:MAG: hypothetical protein QF893_19825, partial [Alphaproteobacteria bacterium]|nr:hypothetical protein [Alphaproteobacteria bacterium]